MTAYDPNGKLVYQSVQTRSPSTYGDGSSFLSERVVTDVYAYDLIGNQVYHAQDITQDIEILLFDATRITSQLVQRFVNGAEEKHEFSAFVECLGGELLVLTEAEFITLRQQLGL